ncbi:hypothetical protein [Streptomyces virginiae]|uniref:hypothetical protein n=1 Tax=Streptomyces virginiae TaxID=1961 RepID=UPI0036EE9C68
MGTTRGVNVHVAASRRGDMNFLARVRELAGDKPVGFKLCVGSRRGFLAVCKALREADITPDFIRPVWPAPGELIASPLESWAADGKAADPDRCTHSTR